ncbi:hypothetical protein TSOC_009381 [Tetrabaena socialis]|uniref:Uncharacterized protein n=1 Tax=Tetrabaena socialis TaxID=47790 RepID=A0A2J7ZW15_9CHLO|nr:hypothetical protein TSOC_009381 [Tetrabaena socialis]|eukprot:PNH04463.1 hypothetical protein TSOC_009381 [Tetrabaena socialis]
MGGACGQPPAASDSAAPASHTCRIILVAGERLTGGEDASAPRWGGDAAPGPPGATSDGGDGSNGSSGPPQNVAAADDWGLDLVGVPRLQLVDSVVRGLPLSSVGPLLQCLGCGRLTVSNLTLQDLAPPLATGSTGGGSGADGGSDFGGGTEGPVWYGAARFSSLTSATLDGVRCSNVTGSQGWACLLLQLRRCGAGTVALRRSWFVGNTVVAPQLRPPAPLDPPAAPDPPATAPPDELLPSVPSAAPLMPPAGAPAPPVPLGPPGGAGVEGRLGEAGAVPGAGAPSGQAGGATAAAATATDADAPPAAAVGGSSTDGLPWGLLHCLDDDDDDGVASQGYGAVLVSYTDSEAEAGSGAAAAAENGVGGDGVAAAATVSVYDCVFRGNAGGCGGGLAVLDLAGLLLITSSTLAANTATRDGGGAYLRDGRAAAGLVLMCNSRLVANSTQLNGGAVAVDSGNVTALVISGSTLRRNTAASCGGGLYAMAQVGVRNVTVEASNVSHNAAGNSGGGLYVMANGGGMDGLRMDSGSRLCNNSVAVNGGALFVSATGNVPSVSINGVELYGNTATYGSGGAVYVLASGMLAEAVVGGGAALEANTAGGSGGAVFLSSGTTVGSVSVTGGSKLSGNHANYGGALSVRVRGLGGIGLVEVGGRSELWNNSAGGDAGSSSTFGDGGALLLMCGGNISSLLVSGGSSLRGNGAAGSGGAVYAATHGAIGVFEVTGGGTAVVANTAMLDGGGVYLQGDRGISGIKLSNGALAAHNRANNDGYLYAHANAISGGMNAAVTANSSVSSNVAGLNGGGLHLTGTKISLAVTGSSSLCQNAATLESGGAVYADANDYLELISITDDSKLDLNRAGMHGGAIYANSWDGVGALLVGGGSSLGRNVAGTGDGAAAASGGNGGALNVQTFGSILAVNITGGSRLYGNNCTGDGGGVMLQALGNISMVTFDGGMMVYGNVAGGSGGAVFVDASVVHVAVGGPTRFESNSVGGGGGALCVRTGSQDAAGSISIGGASTLSHNNATSGGALYVAGYAYVSLGEGSVLSGNRAATDGGGAAFTRLPPQLLLHEATVANNTAERGSGGAFYIAAQATSSGSGSSSCGRCALDLGPLLGSTSTTSISHSSLIGNSAFLDGGALLLSLHESCCESRAVLSLASCTLVSNTAGGVGGAVAVINPAGAAGSHVFTGVEATNCSFSANSVGSGSGTYSNTGSQGGALFMWYQPQQPDAEVEAACMLRAEASTFERNACNGGNGGALMLVSCGLRLARCAFESNTATLSGGAVACLHLEFGGGLYLDAQAHGLVLLRGCRLQDNVASVQHGGALFLAAGGACSGATLIDSNLTGNAAAVASAGAAYVLLGGGALGALNGVAMASNRAATRGGGAVLDVRQNGTLKVRGCVLDGNTAGSGGGGGAVLLVQPGGGAALEQCAMRGNTAAGSGGGGGLHVRAGCGARVSVLGTNLTANDAGGSGGAVYVMYGSMADDGASAAAGGDGQQRQGCADGSAAELSELAAGGNRAGDYGGAVFLAPGSAARLAGAQLYGNTAGGSGGGVAALNCSYLAVSNGSISGCTAAAGSGGGVYAAGCGRVLLQRGSVWRNEAVAGKGGGIYLAGPGGDAESLQLPSAGTGVTAAPATAAAFTSAVVHRVQVYGNRAVQGGGVFCTAGVAAALSQCDLARGNAAPFGSALASTQRCGAVANTSVPPGAAQPWALAWAFLDLAARQRCSALLLSDSLLPHIRDSGGDGAGSGAASQRVLPLWMMDPTASALQARCSDDANGIVRAADADDSAGAAAIARQGPAQAATAIGFTMQRHFQASAASASAAAAAAAATGAAASSTLPSPSPWRITNSTTNASDTVAEAILTRYKNHMAGLSQCWDGPAMSARDQRAVVKARGAYLGFPPTKLRLLRTGVVAEELARQGDLQLRRLVLSLRAGRDFDVSVQLYDSYGQPVTSVIAPFLATLALLPVPPGGSRYNPAAADGSRPWRHNGSGAYLDAGFKKSLSVPVEAGVATWRKVAARGWPGRYSLTFALSGGEASQVQVSARTASFRATRCSRRAGAGEPPQVDPLELSVELLPCALGETLDLSVAKRESAPMWTACTACLAEQYGMWQDERPLLASQTYDNPGYLGLMAADAAEAAAVATCQACPASAACPGGAVVVPDRGFWHSAPNSTAIHRCPSDVACGAAGSGSDLDHWRRMGFDGDSVVGQLQQADPDPRSTHLVRCQKAWYDGTPPGAAVRKAYDARPVTVAGADGGVGAGGSGDGGGGGGGEDLAEPPVFEYGPEPSPPAPLPLGAGPPPPPPSGEATWCLLWGLPPDSPESYMQQQCAPGYTGNLCAVCVPGFFINPDFMCQKCPSLGRTLSLGLLSFFGSVALVLFTAMSNFAEGFGAPGEGEDGEMGGRRYKAEKKSQGATIVEGEEEEDEEEEEEEEHGEPQEGGKGAAKEAGLSVIVKPQKHKVETVDVVKVIVVHIQYFVIVIRLNIDYPSLINRCQAAFSALTGAENYFTSSPSCLRPAQDSAGQAQIQLLAGLLTPCAVVLVSMLMWASRFYIKHPPAIIHTLSLRARGSVLVLAGSIRRTIHLCGSGSSCCSPHLGQSGCIASCTSGKRPKLSALATANASAARAGAMPGLRSVFSDLQVVTFEDSRACGSGCSNDGGGSAALAAAASGGDDGGQGARLPKCLPLHSSSSAILHTDAASGATVVDLQELLLLGPTPSYATDATAYAMDATASGGGGWPGRSGPSLLRPTLGVAAINTVASSAAGRAPTWTAARPAPRASGTGSGAPGKVAPVPPLPAEQQAPHPGAHPGSGPRPPPVPFNDFLATPFRVAMQSSGGVGPMHIGDLGDCGGDRSSVLTGGGPSILGGKTRISGGYDGSRSSMMTRRNRGALGVLGSGALGYPRRSLVHIGSSALRGAVAQLGRMGTAGVSVLERPFSGSSTLSTVDREMRLSEQLAIVLMAAVFILYPAWASAALSTFACYRIDEGRGAFAEMQQATWQYGYWVRNMNQACYTGSHLDVYLPIGLAAVVVFCLAPPLASFLVVWRARGNLDNPRTQRVYGFLYKRYRPRFMWWETVLQVETLALVTVEVLGRGLPVAFQALLLLAAFTVVLLINIGCTALRSRLLVLMEFLSLGTLSLTITLSLYFTVGQPLDAGSQEVLAVLIVVLNVALLAFFLCVISRPCWPATARWVRARTKALKARLTACAGHACPRPPGTHRRRGGSERSSCDAGKGGMGQRQQQGAPTAGGEGKPREEELEDGSDGAAAALHDSGGARCCASAISAAEAAQPATPAQGLQPAGLPGQGMTRCGPAAGWDSTTDLSSRSGTVGIQMADR